MDAARPLNDQVAVVTGGSRGIGRATVLELARAGARVVVGWYQAEDAAGAVVDQIEAAGGQALAWQVDVTERAQVERLLAAAQGHFGRVDVLVPSAGIVRDQLAATLDDEAWSSVIETNLSGTFATIRAALPAMIVQKSGSIVALSSTAAQVGSRGHVNYAASKGGVEALVRALAVELAPKGIRVNAVAPGLIETEMSQRVRDWAADEIRQRIPLGRFGQPDEVARVIRFLASPEASYITGEIVRVAGGLGA